MKKRLPKHAVFLDRDGVINKAPKGAYIKSWEEFEFIPDIFYPLKTLTKAGFLLIIITNQSGIGRGLISWDSFQDMNIKMLKSFREKGVSISGIYFCPHIPEFGCLCRKPNPTLVTLAAHDFNVELNSSFFIGDTDKDIETGVRAGCKTIFVATGQQLIEDIAVSCHRIDFTARNLKEGADWLLEQFKEEPQN